MESVKPILEINNLDIAYVNDKNEQREIVNNGEITINPGELVLVIGENGSGKSSIFRSIVGDLNDEDPFFTKLINFFKNLFKKKKVKFINSKNMTFDGRKIENDSDLNYLRKSVGFSRQEDDVDSFYARRVWNYILDYASSAYGYESLSTPELKEKAEFVYQQLDCEKYCDGKLKKMRLNKCSGGEKKITSLLAALSRRDAKLYILDEPINNLDAYHARKLNNYLVDLKNSDNHPGILIITHCPMFLDVDRVYELKKGKLTLLDKNAYQAKSCYGICDKNNKKYLEEE